MKGSSKCITGILLLLSVLAVSALDKDVIPSRQYNLNFIKKYTATRMMMYCYGHRTVSRWQNKVEQFWYECEKIKRPFNPNPKKHYEQFPFTLKPFFGSRRVSALRYENVIGIEILQCVFDKMNLKISGGKINSQSLRSDLKSLHIAKRLKRYVEDGVNKCEALANCDSFDDFGAQYVGFSKLHEFYRCEMKNRLTACIRFDLDRHRKEFKILSIKKLFAGLDDSTRRVAMATFFSNSNMRGPFNIRA